VWKLEKFPEKMKLRKACPAGGGRVEQAFLNQGFRTQFRLVKT